MAASCGNVLIRASKSFANGWWRSLVAHLTGGQGVAGSNPVHPTRNFEVRAYALTFLHQACTKESRFCTKRAPNFGLILHQNANRQVVAGLVGLQITGFWGRSSKVSAHIILSSTGNCIC